MTRIFQEIQTFRPGQNAFCLHFFFGATVPSGPGPPHSRGYSITHNDAPQSVGLLWMSDQPVAETSKKIIHNTHNGTDIHAPGWIRTHNLSRRAAADLRLRPHGHWDRHFVFIFYPVLLYLYFLIAQKFTTSSTSTILIKCIIFYFIHRQNLLKHLCFGSCFYFLLQLVK